MKRDHLNRTLLPSQRWNERRDKRPTDRKSKIESIRVLKGYLRQKKRRRIKREEKRNEENQVRSSDDNILRLRQEPGRTLLPPSNGTA